MTGARALSRRATAPRTLALCALLAVPVCVAFASGGYFDEARLLALIGSAVVLVIVTIITPRPLPRGPWAIVALAGLWALTGWTAASIGWAPLRGPAFHDAQRLLLYAIWFTAAVALLREWGLARIVEPLTAAGLSIVLVYGLAGRMLPGVVHESHSARAGGRLDQPLTYWNAEGAFAGLALVVCARLAGDPGRRWSTRAAAAAACAPAGMALYLSYSRGALGAAAAGLLVLLAAAPDHAQLRAAALAVVAAVLGAAVAAPFPVVASLQAGSRSQGVAALILLCIVAAAAALVLRYFVRSEARGHLTVKRLAIRHFRGALAIAAVAVVVGFVVVTATVDRTSAGKNPATGATAARLTSVQSHRYAYWKVALGAFADHPLAGLGSGGFGVRWLERRKIPESVVDAHSLYIETAGELGIVGLLALFAFFAGIAVSARAALGVDEALVAGALAAFVTWAVHAGVDWLWEMPAVSLLALGYAALLVAQGENARARPRS